MRINQKIGSLTLEAVIATGLASIFFTAVAGVLIGATTSMQSLYKKTASRLAAEESMAALRSISFDALTPTATGSISYSTTTNQWSLAPGTETLTNGITRTISIENISRDASCTITTNGGTVDPDSKRLTSTIAWLLPNGLPHEYIISTLRTRWDDPQGACFKPTQAGSISVITTSATWGGSKQLRDVQIENMTNNSATVTAITVTWNNPSSQIQQMFIGSGKIWSDGGPGTPSGTQSSGTRIDVQDFTIPANSIGETYKIQFTGAMSGTTLDITFEFADGSSLSTGPFIPQ